MKSENFRRMGFNPQESETRLRYIFSHPDDKQRDIIVTLMLFNMPKPK